MKTHKATIYKDKRGTWRWNIIAANGKIIADSGEGYDTRSKARRAWLRLGYLFIDGKIESVSL